MPDDAPDSPQSRPLLALQRERWFNNAIVYSVSVEHFFDDDGDGRGDLHGLHRRLDYIVALGADCIWLLPTAPSPMRDFGYDVTDFYGVREPLGDLGDLAQLIRAAHQRNLRVIIDLSLQHTSIDHRWFQEGRRDRRSRYRDYYVWSDELPPEDEWPEQVVFTGNRARPWSYDDVARSWYRHIYYAHEPDLNLLEPRVREEIQRVLAFWLQLGVDGVRIDSAARMSRQAAAAYGGDPTGFLRELRATAAIQRPDAVMLLEADEPPDRLHDFMIGSEAGLLLFNFYLSARLFLAFARGSAGPLRQALDRLPVPEPAAQFANFLRNHDELDLETLSDAERREVLARYAPDDDMRIFGRGIRRRLAPMLDGDQSRLRSAFSVLLAMPGVPVVLYGDELGVGEDLAQPDRGPVRVAMPWAAVPNAGFSSDPQAMPLVPVVPAGAFSADRVNAIEQRRNESSLFNWVAAAIRARRECAHIGWGVVTVLETSSDSLLALRYDWAGEVAVIVNNLSSTTCEAQLEGVEDLDTPLEIFADRDYRDDAVLSLGDPLPIGGLGYRWFRISQGSPRAAASGR